MNKRNAVIILLVVILAVAGGFAVRKYQKDKLYQQLLAVSVASVDGKPFRVADFEKALNFELAKIYYGTNQDLSADARAVVFNQVLSEAIDQKLISDYNQSEKLFTFDAAKISQDAQQRLNSLLPDTQSKEKFEKALKRYNSNMPDALVNMENQIRKELIQQAMTASFVMSDQDALNYYNANKDMYYNVPGKVNLSVIRTKDEKDGKTVLEQLAKKAKFEDLVKSFSIDDATKDKEGLMGDIKTNDDNYDPTFLKTAQGLKVAQVSQLLNINGSYYILRLNSKEEGKIFTFAQKKEEIKTKSPAFEALKANYVGKKIAELQQKAKVTMNKEEISKVIPQI